MYKFYETIGRGISALVPTAAKYLQRGYAGHPSLGTWLMRINFTCLMLLVAFLQVGVAARAQKITLFKRNAPLMEIIREIKAQSGFDFVINQAQISNARPVTIEVNGEPLEDVLEKCFRGQPFTYSIESSIIVVREKEPSLLDRIKKTFKLPINISGKVADGQGQPLPGAAVRVKGLAKGTITDNNGLFRLESVPDTATLIISMIGFKTVETLASSPLSITLETDAEALEQVYISTGYQVISPERMTGSVSLIDNSLINRSVSRNILERLNGVTSGLLFDKNQRGNAANVSIRGRSTIFADPDPLIVLDNFPYEGDLGNINPNDIENITVLKDAAAASIWGTRAGNGVVVITTKRGKYNQKTQVNFNSNINIGEKPDLYYQPWFTSADYVEMEQYLFDRGYYNANINNGYSGLSPAVKILLKKSNNDISEDEAAEQLNTLKDIDVRDALSEYYYRQSVDQQYALNITGGGSNNKYFISGGYDRNLSSNITNTSERFSLNANNTYSILKNKIEITTGILFSKQNSRGNADTYLPATPYDRLVDENGNHLDIERSTSYRSSYTDTAGSGHLLDWRYRPLDENYVNSRSNINNTTVNLGLNYSPRPYLNINGLYQYQKQLTNHETDRPVSSYFVRDMINRFTQINRSTGEITHPVPLGGIYDHAENDYQANYGRLQLNFEKNVGPTLHLNIMTGGEIRDNNSASKSFRYFGYNTETGMNSNSLMDFITPHPLYYNISNTERISPEAYVSGNVDRYLSYYGNAALTFLNRYILSLSARKDESNLFGVKSNQKGVPLWSTGLVWNLHNESFFHLHWLNRVQLKGSLGYTGNVDKTTSAYLTTQSGEASNSLNQWRARYTEVANPPNPSLKWERIHKINMGVNYGILNDRISGSLEFYRHKGIDLIGNSPIAPQTGVSSFRGNSANTRTSGIDLILNTVNFRGSSFQWATDILFNTNRDKVTSYKIKQGSNSLIIEQNYTNPIEGYPFNPVFSYQWAGLDTLGNPLGVFNGEISADYNAIRNLLNPEQLVYHGQGSPGVFGNIRNDVSWKNIGLSVNISYKFNYYFRRSGVFDGSTYGYRQTEYGNRWQNPGDEARTIIPSIVYPANFARSGFFNYSEVLVEKGDHIRLRDIRLSYDFISRNQKNKGFSSVSVFAYANNLGILWRANDKGIDPDAVSSIPAPRTWALGFRAAL